jgi:S1-C subfamily serine protease
MKQVKKISILPILILLCFGMLFSSCSVMEDTKPPSAPVLTITRISKDSVDLAWSESYDNVGIDKYRVYRDGESIADVDYTEYKDRNVREGESYEYYVIAFDKAGNKSSKSAKQTVAVGGDVVVPDGPNNTPEPGMPGKPENTDLNRLAKSTVRLYILDDDFNCIATGSGTIVNDQGYIITNYHCVGEASGLYNSEGWVAIAITDDVRVASQPQYLAQYRSGIYELDLAVVKIMEDINGNRVSAEELRKLSPAKIGDSNTVEIGDGINILGYPGVGGDTITFTAGKVSGFIDENNDKDVDWIKTDAIVNHGNSGGTAVNEKGEMVGIPTAKLVAQDNDIMFYLKPVNQALPILDDAIAQGDDPVLPPRDEPGITVSESVDIMGRIVDAYTEEPLAGAVFVILQAGVTVQEFIDNPRDSMLLSYSETDYDGFFYCPAVPLGNSYSVIIGADGYSPIVMDDALELPAYLDEYWIDLGDVALEAEY